MLSASCRHYGVLAYSYDVGQVSSNAGSLSRKRMIFSRVTRPISASAS